MHRIQSCVEDCLILHSRPQTIKLCPFGCHYIIYFDKRGVGKGRPRSREGQKKWPFALTSTSNSKERRKENFKPLRRRKKKGVEAERRLDDEPWSVTGLKLFFPVVRCSFDRITVFCYAHSPANVGNRILFSASRRNTNPRLSVLINALPRGSKPLHSTRKSEFLMASSSSRAL